MPQDIIQFQVVSDENVGHTIYILTKDGKIYYSSPSGAGGGEWRELS